MLNRLILNASLAVSALLMPRLLQAQCYGNPQAEGWTCSSTPMTLTPFSTCPTCTHTWNPTPASGQGTALATYQYNPAPNWGQQTTQVSVSSYNPNAQCSYGDMWQIGIGFQPSIALPSLVNGPWNGDTSRVWIYARSYMNPLTFGGYSFFPSWSVTGGTIRRSNHFYQFSTYHDSVYVKWNGSAAMSLHESQLTQHSPQNMISTFNCNWNATPTQIPSPALAVFYNGGVCAGTAKNFFTFPYANSTYTWSVTNGTVVSGQGTSSVQIIMSAAGTVSVARDSSGTITNANTSVTPFVPVVNLGPDQNICQGASTTLNAGPGFTSYLWSTGATTQSIVVSNPAQYRVTATINGSCIAMDTINIGSIPVVRPNLGPDIHTCTFPVTLNAGPGYVSYAWSNGATTQTTAANFGGSYRVTVTDGNGCLSRDTIIVFNSQPTINLNANYSFCAPGPLTLNPSTSNVTAYLWSTGATTPSIQVTSSGTQSIWLQGSNVYGCTAADTTIVTGNPRPTPNLGPDRTICPGASTTLDAGPGYTGYFWANGPSTQQYTVSNPGSYRVTVYNSFNCSASDTIAVFNHPVTPVNLGPDINVCQPSATLDAGPGYTAYLWSTGATTRTIAVTTGGTYSVTVTGAGGCTYSDAINVTFNTFNFSFGNDTTICEPGSLILNPGLVGNFTYLWNNGATTPTLSLSSVGTHNVNLTAVNSFGCTDSDTIIVTILPTPVSQLGGDTILCPDTTITLNAGAGFASYVWSTGASTQTIVAASGGVYSMTATAANGCIRRDTIMISGMIDCVFPGDVNYDHTADIMDVLALGTSMGATGMPRSNPSTAWYGQWVWNWSGNITSGVNRKQGDTDGNGVINAADTVAIYNNYGNMHTRMGSVTGGSDRLRVVPINSPVTPGGLAGFAVYLENASGGDVDSLHGLAMQISWPTNGLATQGLKFIDFGSNWFAAAQHRLTMTHVGGNSAAVAVTRTTGVDTAGHGLVMILEFETDSAYTGPTWSFTPTVTMVQSVGVDLVPNSIQPDISPATVIGTVSQSPSVLAHLRIWPIPANDLLRLEVDGQQATRIQLVNLMGQLVYDQICNGEREFSIPVSGLPSGNYCLQVQTEGGLFVKKVVVER